MTDTPQTAPAVTDPTPAGAGGSMDAMRQLLQVNQERSRLAEEEAKVQALRVEMCGYLLDSGLVAEVGRSPSAGGKAAILLSVVADAYHLIGLVLGESLLIASAGGLIGIVMSYPILKGLGGMLPSFFSGFEIRGVTLIMAGIFVILVGILASFFPIYRAVRIKIVDGLRNVG